MFLSHQHPAHPLNTHSLSRAPSLPHFSHPLSGLPHCLASLLLPSVLCPLPLSHLEPHIHFRDTLFSLSPWLMHDCILRVTECSSLLMLITLRLRTSRSDRDRNERIRGKGKSINKETVKHLTVALHCANNPFLERKDRIVFLVKSTSVGTKKGFKTHILRCF